MAVNKVNYKGNEFEINHNVEVLTAEDFFISIPSSIEQFYACRYGNIINIQRVKISRISYQIDTPIDIGNIKPKYQPAIGDISVRLAASTGGGAIDTIVFLEEGKLIVFPSKSVSAEVFIFNSTYIINAD